MRRLAVSTLALLLFATPALADDATGERRPDRIDGAIVLGAIAASLAPMALPLRDRTMWDAQLLGAVDGAVCNQFSRPAAQLSDLTLIAAIAAPAAYLTGATIDDADGDRLVIYGESMTLCSRAVHSASFAAEGATAETPMKGAPGIRTPGICSDVAQPSRRLQCTRRARP